MSTTTKTLHLAIKATSAEVWDALVDPAVTPTYYFGFAADFGELEAGTPYRYLAGGQPVITGEVLEVRPGRTLRMSFQGHWDEMVAGLPESTVTFDLLEPVMPSPGVTILRCVHEDLPAEAAGDLELGWTMILSGLKSVLETGTPLVAAPAQVA